MKSYYHIDPRHILREVGYTETEKVMVFGVTSTNATEVFEHVFSLN